MTAFVNTLIYIVDLAGKIYISIVLLRFLLQMVRADFYNVISQFIVKVTHPLLKPLRKVIPSVGRQDTSSLILAYLLQLLLVILNLAIIYLIVGLSPHFSILTLAVVAFIRLIDLAFYLCYLLFIGAAILSWIAPDSRSAAATLIKQITSYLLAPLRRIIPPIGIVDITPMVALILLMLINGLIIGTITSYSGIQPSLFVITGG